MAEAVAVAFGPFRVLRAQRIVLDGKHPVRLGHRAFDILTALVDRAGETVSNEELMARAWPDTVVDDANLRVQVRALRRALGDGQGGARYIVNVPLRGYCFVAPVAAATALGDDVLGDQVTAARMPELPLPLARLVGRDQALTAIGAHLSRQRLVSVVGAAGTGKSTVAVAAAQRAASEFRQGICFVDLAPLVDPALVPTTLASALQIALPQTDHIDALVRALREQDLIVVLDNCEHLVAAAAAMAERLLRGVPGIAILATSREPLRVPGEWVYRLSGLPTPPPDTPLTAAEAMQYPAVELFVERALASFDAYTLTDGDARVLGDLCRTLDGIPLAIELAAARVDSASVRDLATHLDDAFRLRMVGKRTALPRQYTLRGALDWSYATLSPVQQRALRYLAVFPAHFDIDGATSLTSDEESDTADALVNLTELIDKSLVTADVFGDKVQYRLLATTRAYALDKLEKLGEVSSARRKHALHTQRVLEQLELGWDNIELKRWCDEHASIIDDVRAVMNWAFAEKNDAELGVAVAALSTRCGSLLSLHAEFRGYIARALDSADSAKTNPANIAKLILGLVRFNHHARGTIDPSITRAQELAQVHGAFDDQVLSLEGVWARELFDLGNYAAALDVAKKHLQLTARAKEAADRFNSERVFGISLHFCGDQAAARPFLERVVAHGISLKRPDKPVHIDMRISAAIALSRVLWLQGYPLSAEAEAERALKRARAAEHAISICYVLAFARLPLALWRGARDEALEHVQALRDEATRFSLKYWQQWASFFEYVTTEPRTPLPALSPLQRELLQTLDPLALAPEPSPSLTAETWCSPELLRLTAEQLVRNGPSSPPADAQAILLRSLDLARKQRALVWELRTAASLARLWRGATPPLQVRALLEPLLARVPEENGTPEVLAVRSALEALDAESA